MTHKRWTEDEQNIIRRDYKHTRKSRRELADRLGVSDGAVAGQIAYMGIARSDDRHAWSEKEKERLAELIPQYCLRAIAIKMHRSQSSVTVMSKRLKASRRYREGWFNKSEVCAILGHDHRWVQTRIESGSLVATSHYGGQPQKLGMSAWHIMEDDLVWFIRRYPQELVGCNIDIITIVELLAGIVNGRDHKKGGNGHERKDVDTD